MTGLEKEHLVDCGYAKLAIPMHVVARTLNVDERCLEKRIQGCEHNENKLFYLDGE